MRIGANYTPREGWFHAWLDLDLDSVQRDLDALAGLGLDHVRLFPLWPVLQPARLLVVRRAIDDLLAVVDAAGRSGLDVSVDVLNGHLSSFDFLPSWAVTWHRRNLFTDPGVVEAQELLVREVAGALSSRPHATGICLGNEFGQFAAARHPSRSETSAAQAGAWLDRLLGAAREAFPTGRHVHSFDDDLWFVDQHPFTPEHAVTRGDLTTVHSWVFGGVGPRFGQGHPALAAFARYLVELAAAWSDDPTRPVWLQEVGAPSTHVTADQAPDFLRATLEQLDGAPNLEAVTWWCSHDVSRTLPDFPELEYSLGLLDAQGHAKPIGRQLAEMVPDLRRRPIAEPAQDRPSVTFAAADGLRSATNPHSAVFDQWLAGHLAGATPALQRW